MFFVSLIVYILALLFIFFLLAKICDEYFVESLDLITKRLKLSQDVAGATFMAIGSSAPELFTAIIALTKVGSENIGAGTIVGSAIFNILVIVGASAVVATAYLNWRPVARDMGFYIVSILLLLFTFRDGRITTTEALVYVFAYLVYLLVLANWKKFLPGKDKKDFLEEVESEVGEAIDRKASKKGFWATFVRIIDPIIDATFPDLRKKPNLFMLTFFISIAYIAVLSWGLVEIAVNLGHLLHVSESIIALTVLAAGTSVPDLLSSLIVAKKGRGDMAISNAVGSNTFDVLIGLGLPWFVYTLIKGKDVVVSTENLMSSIFLLFFTVVALLFIIIMQEFKVTKKAGYILIGVYILYLVYAIFHALFPESFSLDDMVKHSMNNFIGFFVG